MKKTDAARAVDQTDRLKITDTGSIRPFNKAGTWRHRPKINIKEVQPKHNQKSKTREIDAKLAAYGASRDHCSAGFPTRPYLH